MDVIEQLQQLGFSQYEAQAYVALLRESPLNGYELAKASGIPRANIYTVLQRLEEAGAVMRHSTPEGTRYAPLPADELLDKLNRQYQQSLERAADNLRQLATPPALEAVLNFHGYAEMVEQARALIDRAQQHLLISVWPEEALALAGALRQAAERGVAITTLCLRACPEPCPACQGAVFRYALAPMQDDARWLVLVADSRELIAGEIHAQPGEPLQAEGTASAVRTRQQMLVNLTGSYIQNSIALACILTGLGDRLDTALDAESAAALNALRPLRGQGAWLETMRRLLRQENS